MPKHIYESRVNWGRAIEKVMAESWGLQTQKALARRAGMSQSTIGRILRGEADPQAGNLERIARAFKMTLAQLAELAQEGVPVSKLTAPDPTSEGILIGCQKAALITWVEADSFGLILVVEQPQSEP
jgi:transcriptional regulator with XRE-family HTH domain